MGRMDKFASLDRDAALAIALETGAADNKRLALAKAVARRVIAGVGGGKRSLPAVLHVWKIADEDAAENARKGRAVKRNAVPITAGVNTTIRDRPEYVSVRDALDGIIRASPERPTETDDQLLAKFRREFGAKVTERLFKEAKSAAIKVFPQGAVDAWRVGGRPRRR